ncbi:glycosyltransferase, MSMEG_0565 family [Brevundimonas diminuta]|uniref:glycosyltransferase family 4 protein n=1 Tax=Brevundimonas diminuta TaxID=293 RepID=UPI000207EB38|nr:glycosyltransferase family 1 protein [Brevundimonas diminuta]EGF96649.1 putative glycosyltransferase WcbB [Brevundimonas diminuta ATCC 11568]OWR16997.1 glycosyl transferase family 1 [Brevundimonas diminuta]WQE44678.1 glycosyltransferase family 1 protein [Brevundimonas diminuta]SPU45578.1 glycosyltransferase, MSMEG_0565 family [Brevundimonas diminuta]SUW17194.1 glycosyltransferase, MSMEG_0565 family [Brevundimonas diminuta]
MPEDILFDASRLLSRTERSAPTGVDRVCLAYAEWLIEHPTYRMTPVRARKDQLARVDNDWFRERLAELRTRWTGPGAVTELGPEARKLFDALRSPDDGASIIGRAPEEKAPPKTKPKRIWKQYFRSRRIAAPPSARAYINVGHTSLNTPDILTSLAGGGIERIIMVHDLIPVTHPEFCRPGDGLKHVRRMTNVLRHASRIIVNSQYTADELKGFADQSNIAAPPIEVAHLGLERTFDSRTTIAPARPYFLHVGTIEARKNLAFLLTVWRRLQETMGADTPRLVLVGRYGWENEAVLDHLQRSPNLRGLVHQAENLPDCALSALMRGARAMVAPSSVEGFDLPAVEASAMGVPLIASNIAAHRELVPHARLIDPLDGLGWLAALEDWTRNSPVAPPYSPPNWDQHFDVVQQRVLCASGGAAA